MSLHTDLIAAGLPVEGTAVEGQRVFWTRELTPQEAVTAESIINPKAFKQNAAIAGILALSNWPNWTPAQLQNWWDNNLSDAMVDALSVPAAAKTMLKAQNQAILNEGKMIIFIRDYLKLGN